MKAEEHSILHVRRGTTSYTKDVSGWTLGEYKATKDESGNRVRIVQDLDGKRYHDYLAEDGKHELVLISQEKRQKPPHHSTPLHTSPHHSPPHITHKEKEREYQIKSLLEAPRPSVSQIKAGVHNGVFFFGTVLYQGTRQLTAILTSDRQLHVDWGKGGVNEIREKFGLHYRYDFEFEVLDAHLSTEAVKKYLEGDKVRPLKELFEQIRSKNEELMFYPEKEIHELVALDILGTYFLPLFEAYGRTFLESEKGSGKTRQCTIYKLLACNPVMSADVSKSSFFRIMESTCCTLIIDDFDTIGEEQKNDVLQHYKTGYKNSSKSIRTGEGRTRKIDAFRNYGHVVMNNTAGLDEISASRTKFLRVVKSNDARTKADLSERDPFWMQVRDELFISALEHWREVAQAYAQVQSSFSARQYEIARPLLALASLIDTELQRRMEAYLVRIFEQQDATDLDQDWWAIILREFAKAGQGKKIAPAALAEAIATATMDLNDPKLKERKKGVARKVGQMLRQFPLVKSSMQRGWIQYELTSNESLISYLQAKNWESLLPDAGCGVVWSGVVEGVNALDRFKELFGGKYAREPLPIEVVKDKLPGITDDDLEHWKQNGDIIETHPGWVMPS